MTSQVEAPDVRRRLVEEAARLLGEEGPSALTTRRLAAGGRDLDHGRLHPLRRDAGAGARGGR